MLRASEAVNKERRELLIKKFAEKSEAARLAAEEGNEDKYYTWEDHRGTLDFYPPATVMGDLMGRGVMVMATKPSEGVVFESAKAKMNDGLLILEDGRVVILLHQEHEVMDEKVEVYEVDPDFCGLNYKC